VAEPASLMPPDAAPETVALVVAAGKSVRAGGETPKQYRLLGGQPLLRHAVAALAGHPAIGRVHVVVAEGEQYRARKALGSVPASIGVGGTSRQESVLRGLEQLAQGAAPSRVLVHDAARPLLPAALIDRVLAALAETPGACPALPVVDSLRRGDALIEGEVARDGLWRVQTPQGFDFRALLAAHRAAPHGATDDAEVLRAAGHEVRLVAGDERAMKVTNPEDFAAAERLMDWVTLTGSGYDVHRLGPGDHVWLCGVPVPHSHGLVGHSDADVGLHALTDAILGALGDGDIGVHFPPTDPRWKGASSDRFLAHAASLVRAAGGRILHCDVTLICEAPKVGPHRPAMLARLAEILVDDAPRLSVKATTTEGLGFTGRREGIAAQAVATIRLPNWNRP
jgi:2-C-methyl-D-erythritol 4-phosphate cytidylyltransferase/2-C-methyl-D-erythritol 2,4-cyclodiphosphate synthase